MGSFRFGHWLNRQVGYEALLRSDRRVLHRKTAEAMEGRLFPAGGAESGDTGTPEGGATVAALARPGRVLYGPAVQR